MTAPPLNPGHIRQDKKNTRELGALEVRLSQLEGVTTTPALKEGAKRALMSKQAEGRAATTKEQRQRPGLKYTAGRWRQ